MVMRKICANNRCMLCSFGEARRSNIGPWVWLAALLIVEARRFARRAVFVTGSRPSLRKAFHIVGNDDLRRVGLAQALQIFEAASQFGSSVLQAGLERRLGRLASLLVRELLKHDGRAKPPLF